MLASHLAEQMRRNPHGLRAFATFFLSCGWSLPLDRLPGGPPKAPPGAFRRMQFSHFPSKYGRLVHKSLSSGSCFCSRSRRTQGAQDSAARCARKVGPLKVSSRRRRSPTESHGGPRIPTGPHRAQSSSAPWRLLALRRCHGRPDARPLGGCVAWATHGLLKHSRHDRALSWGRRQTHRTSRQGSALCRPGPRAPGAPREAAHVAPASLRTHAGGGLVGSRPPPGGRVRLP